MNRPQKKFVSILFIMATLLIGIGVMEVKANSQTAVKKPVNTSYSLRKYPHVKQFYNLTTKEAIKIGLADNVPPAAILAIAGWESGYGQGYVSQITGNIMSLGARKGEAELPPLTLPKNLVSKQIMIDIDKAKRLPKNQVIWQKRPPSLKKDYRPAPYAGTAKNLLYFKNHPQALKLAYRQVMNDFASSWISTKSKVPVFREAENKMNLLAKKQGKTALLNCQVAKAFVKSIGGKPRSFNTRPAWIKHVNKVMDNAGLCQLTQQVYQGKTFTQAW